MSSRHKRQNFTWNFMNRIFKNQRERDTVRQPDRKVPQMHLQPSSAGQTALHMAVKILLYHTPRVSKMLLIFPVFLLGSCSSFRRAEVLQRTVSECQVKARWIRVISSTWLLPNPTIWGKHRTRWGNTPVWDTSGTQRDLLLNTGLLLSSSIELQWVPVILGTYWSIADSYNAIQIQCIL